MQITAETPTTEYTIAKHKFTVFRPFAEGSVLTANEAASMNQTFAENVRNNFTAKIKAAEEAGAFDQAAMQAALDAYQQEYEFGVRRGRPAGAGGTGGGRKSDPVTTRAMELARNAVRKKITELGGNPKDYDAKEITARAKAAVEANPKFRELAAKQLDEENIDVGDLDSANISGEAKVKRAPKAAA